MLHIGLWITLWSGALKFNISGRALLPPALLTNSKGRVSSANRGAAVCHIETQQTDAFTFLFCA